jgi:hypothetical protein
VKKLFFAFMLLLSLTAVAGTDSSVVKDAGWNKLSESQKAEVLKSIADAAAQHKSEQISDVVAAVDVKKVDEWVSVGERIGKVMGGAAREVGVVVSDFVKSPLGLLTMALVVWKIMGASLLHIVGASLILVVGGIVMNRLYRSYNPREIIYDTSCKNIFGNYPKLKENTPGLSSEEAGYLFFGSWVFLGIATIVLFTG